MRLVIFLILSFLFPAVNAAVDPQLCAKLAQWQASGLDRADIEGKLQGLGLDTKVAESCNRAAAKGRPVPTPTEQAHGDRTQKTIRTANELAAALKGNTDVGVSAPNNGAQNTIRGDRPVRLAVAVASDLSRTPPPAPEGLIQMAQDRMNPIYAQRKFETSRQLELDQARRAVTCASWTSLACARGTLDVGAEYLSLALDALGEKFTGNSGNAEVARFAYDSTPIGGAHRGLEGVYQEPASKMAWAGLGLGLIGLGGLREGLAVERAAVTAAREVAPTAEAARVAASVARVETPIEGGLGIVIDGNLYHGSATSGMKQFDSAAAAAERTVKSDGSATLGHGIYLASDRKAAESYAHIRAEDVNATTPGAGRAPIVYSVASEKLRFLDLSVPGNKAIIRDEYKAYLLARANGAGGATAQEASLAKILASSIDRNPNGFDVHINRAEFTTFLRSRGYDGIVGVAFGEPTVDGTKEFFDHDQYVVFNPAKAKITGEARLPSRTTAPVAIAREVELDGGFVVKLEGKHLFHGSMMAGVKQFDLATGEAKFDSFRPSYTLGRGLYATSDAGAADWYAAKRAGDHAVYELSTDGMKFIDLRKKNNWAKFLVGFKPKLLALSAEIDAKPSYAAYMKSSDKGMINSLLRAIDNERWDFARDHFYQASKPAGFDNWSPSLFQKPLADHVLSLGYDGIVSIEGGEGGGLHDSWVIFDPERVPIVREYPAETAKH